MHVRPNGVASIVLTLLFLAAVARLAPAEETDVTPPAPETASPVEPPAPEVPDSAPMIPEPPAPEPAATPPSLLPPVSVRFQPEAVAAEGDSVQTPSFQRHVVPLLGRLGCNGRACHGSFQGQGGFRLSLFGYDFKADHESLLDPADPRVDVARPLESLLLNKPTDAAMHEGGQRYSKDGWEHQLLRRWIEAGAPFQADQVQRIVALEVTPATIVFPPPGAAPPAPVQLKAVAVWPDGSREDVTPLCRFQTNNEQIASVTPAGEVAAGEAGDSHVVVFYDSAVVPVPVLRPVAGPLGDSYPSVPTPTRIDELVVAKLRMLGIVPSELCSDEEFLRRVRLDMTGSLPTAQEVEQFLASDSPNKRAEKIEELLQTPAYAAWWATRLCDFTGNNEQALVNASPLRGKASEEWYEWIRKRVADNMAYDRLVEGIVLAVSRAPGETYLDFAKAMSDLHRQGDLAGLAARPFMPHYWARRTANTPEDRAIGFAYAFLGVRIQCAQCHKHPFDQWSKDDFDSFKKFFTRVVSGRQGADRESQAQFQALLTELGIQGRPNNNQLRRQLPEMLQQGKTIPFPEVAAVGPRGAGGRRGERPADGARLLGGELVDLAEHDDARAPLMDWLRDTNNPYFARAFVNRVWAGYFHTGIVEPPDDLSLANPPSNKPLLDHLTERFIASGFDMKSVHREIANSRTYQLSWRPNATNAGDERNFSRAVHRRLPAEVAYDAVRQATADDETVVQMHASVSGRAIAAASVGGRGQARGNNANFALTIFGRSIRESNCDCDRSSEASLLQTVFLRNDREVLDLIERSSDSWVAQVEKQSARAQPARGEGERPAPAAEGADGPPESLELQIARIERRLAALKAESAPPIAKIERLQQRLSSLRDRLPVAPPAPDEAADPSTAAAEPSAGADRLGPEELVRQAYLRTLSRHPLPQELDRSLRHLESSPNLATGLKGLLWALVNTKEFIVNH